MIRNPDYQRELGEMNLPRQGHHHRPRPVVVLCDLVQNQSASPEVLGHGGTARVY